jgi:hypothetical protein
VGETAPAKPLITRVFLEKIQHLINARQERFARRVGKEPLVTGISVFGKM